MSIAGQPQLSHVASVLVLVLMPILHTFVVLRLAG